MAPEGLRKLRFFKHVLCHNSAIYGFPGDLRASIEPSGPGEFAAKISLGSVQNCARTVLTPARNVTTIEGFLYLNGSQKF